MEDSGINIYLTNYSSFRNLPSVLAYAPKGGWVLLTYVTPA